MRILIPAILALAITVGSAAEPESVASVMTRLRVDEAATAARSNPLWRAPPKVLLLAFGTIGFGNNEPALRAAARGANVIAARDMQSAIANAADADVIIGYNPEICDQRILGAAKELRWLASLSAGVENCMIVPAIRKPNLLMTN
ncbi:MAG: hypothetical protein ABI859_20910, partial [Pseudomonadota bacterium]